jgi:hypothetical protein
MLASANLPMARNERTTRSQLALSTGFSLVGITSAIYGIDSIGGIVALGGLVFLGYSIHRLGRIGGDQ